MGQHLFIRMEIKRNITFKIRPMGRRTTVFQIRMRVTFLSQRVDCKTGHSISDKEFWDDRVGLVKDGYSDEKGATALSINTDLRKLKDQMNTAFKYFEVIEKIPTPAELLNNYEDRLDGITPHRPNAEESKKKEAKEPDLFEVFDKFVSESREKNAWSIATVKKIATLRNDLSAFKKTLRFSDLTENTLTRFVAYLRDDKRLRTPRKKKGERQEYDKEDITGLKNSTVEKKLENLRWFLKWATDHGYNTNLAFKTFHPTLKRTQKRIIFLTKDELQRVRDLELPEERLSLEPVRDVFLFTCYSGLRHSDAYNLRRTDVKNGSIEVTTIKTADSILIELNNRTREILKKYESIDFPGNKALPVMQNQPMNRALKELCRLAGIDEEIRVTTYKGNERHDEVHPKWELVGTHTGRRTFIVNALSMGIVADIVMKWTGHSDYKAMKPYVDIIDSFKANAMRKFDDL